VPLPACSDEKDEGNFQVDSSIIQYVDELHEKSGGETKRPVGVILR